MVRVDVCIYMCMYICIYILFEASISISYVVHKGCVVVDRMCDFIWSCLNTFHFITHAVYTVIPSEYILCFVIKFFKMHGLYDLFQNSLQRDIKFRPVLFLTFHFVLMDVKMKQ